MCSGSNGILRTLPDVLLICLLIFFQACSGGRDPDSCEIVLVMPTAGGLKAGDPVIFNEEKVGWIAGLTPVADRVEAPARFEKFRPSQSARFELSEKDNGDREIRISDPKPAAVSMKSGDRAAVQLPLKTLEDRLWISR